MTSSDCGDSVNRTDDPARWPSLRGARVRRVIEVEFNHGAGVAPDDPVRRVFAYFGDDGLLLAWADSSDTKRRIDPSFMAKGWRG